MAINREDWVRSVVPSGTVIAFAGVTPPTGWLLCNGSTISRTAYPALFTAISVAHGSGDGSTTFHLPDYQGRFLRGVANGSANDPDRAARIHPVTSAVVGDIVGSVQGDVLQNITGSVGATSRWRTDGAVTGSFSSTSIGNLADSNGGGGSRSVSALNFDASGSARTSTETRPKNANVNYIIKA